MLDAIIFVSKIAGGMFIIMVIYALCQYWAWNIGWAWGLKDAKREYEKEQLKGVTNG